MGRLKRQAVDGVLLLDKPSGLTSNAALQRVKRIFRAEKAGHTGSLDPLASGLLPICFGQATKLSVHLLEADKTYRATVRIGIKTDTGDADGRTIAESEADLSIESLKALIPVFSGTILQTPPMYSAIKLDGLKLYTLAREGIEVEREPREVVIHDLRLHAFGDGQFEFEVRCSKGTYVRTLAEDWLAAAGQLGHLTALRRTAAAPFDGSEMVGLDRLESAAEESAAVLQQFLLPSVSALPSWPQVRVDAVDAVRLRRGFEINIQAHHPSGAVCVLDDAGHLIWLAEHDGRGRLAPRRWLGREPDEAVS